MLTIFPLAFPVLYILTYLQFTFLTWQQVAPRRMSPPLFYFLSEYSELQDLWETEKKNEIRNLFTYSKEETNKDFEFILSKKEYF